MRLKVSRTNLRKKQVSRQNNIHFYDSVENRKMCCGIRKVEPLQRAFSDLDVGICGLRKDQTVSRFFSQLV